MLFILDTNIVSNLRKERPHPALLNWIYQVGWDDIAITSINVMEIQIGIERARREHPDVANIVEDWLSGILDDAQPQVLPLDAEAAIIQGRMYETPKLRTFLIPDPASTKLKTGADLAIAAIAIARDAVVATDNVADFLRINDHFPLPGLYNPFDAGWIIQPARGIGGPGPGKR